MRSSIDTDMRGDVRRRRYSLPHRRVLFALAWGLFFSAALPAAESRDIRALARDFEIKPLADTPEWASSPTAPLFTFAWISDCHVSAGTALATVTQGLNSIRDDLRPDFLVVTGDNSAYAAPGTEASGLPLEQRRHMAFQDLLRDACGLPAAVIPGDNWPWGFETVFGSTRYSFDAGGIHFIFVCPDRSAKGVEGCAVFAADTWAWLTADLQASGTKPTLLFMHQNVVPPTFLESGRLAGLLRENPHVLATMTGHLHLDMEFRRNGCTHIICPSLGRSPVPGYKVVRAYRDRLVVNTWELGPGTDRFAPTLKWQRIVIPDALRTGLGPLDRGAVLRTGRSELPPQPLVHDQSLAARSGDLLLPTLQFMLELGTGILTGAATDAAAVK